MSRDFPTFAHEIELWNEGYSVIGIDEVGRGAFAGPVYVSGVAFTPQTDLKEIERIYDLKINDSKKLTALKRATLSSLIQKENLLHSTKSIDSTVINTSGIMNSLSQAVVQVTEELIAKLPQKKVFILLDGNDNPYKNDTNTYNYRNIIKGDSISLSIAAASILAKVARDTHMTELSPEYPHYQWDKNKGYGTLDHRKAIKQYGESPQHRVLYLRKLKDTLTI
jgi:ribonuclease HII